MDKKQLGKRFGNVAVLGIMAASLLCSNPSYSQPSWEDSDTPPSPRGGFGGHRGPGKGHHKGEYMLEHLQKEVDLSDKQKEEISAIIKRYQPKMEAQRKVMHEIMQSMREEVNQTLTTEQKAKLKESFEKRREHRMERMDKMGRKTSEE